MAPREDEQSPGESVSGSVLRDLLTNPIDQGYRTGMSTHSDVWWKRLMSLVLIIVLTMVAVWAATALRQARSGVDSPTQQLRTQVADRLEIQSLIQVEVDSARAEVDRLHSSALPLDPTEAERAMQLRVASAQAAVTGEGVTITLDDSGASTANERLRDFDLQVVTNALWAAGAEAIDINGQRLSSTSAIRSAGSAILVNLTPLAPPYTVSAIGNPIDLQVEFARSSAAPHIATLRDTFGIRVSIQSVEQLDLMAARETTLRYAEPVP